MSTSTSSSPTEGRRPPVSTRPSSLLSVNRAFQAAVGHIKDKEPPAPGSSAPPITTSTGESSTRDPSVPTDPFLYTPPPGVIVLPEPLTDSGPAPRPQRQASRAHKPPRTKHANDSQPYDSSRAARAHPRFSAAPSDSAPPTHTDASPVNPTPESLVGGGVGTREEWKPLFSYQTIWTPDDAPATQSIGRTSSVISTRSSGVSSSVQEPVTALSKPDQEKEKKMEKERRETEKEKEERAQTEVQTEKKKKKKKKKSSETALKVEESNAQKESGGEGERGGGMAPPGINSKGGARARETGMDDIDALKPLHHPLASLENGDEGEMGEGQNARDGEEGEIDEIDETEHDAKEASTSLGGHPPPPAPSVSTMLSPSGGSSVYALSELDITGSSEPDFSFSRQPSALRSLSSISDLGKGAESTNNDNHPTKSLTEPAESNNNSGAGRSSIASPSSQTGNMAFTLSTHTTTHAKVASQPQESTISPNPTPFATVPNPAPVSVFAATTTTSTATSTTARAPATAQPAPAKEDSSRGPNRPFSFATAPVPALISTPPPAFTSPGPAPAFSLVPPTASRPGHTAAPLPFPLIAPAPPAPIPPQKPASSPLAAQPSTFHTSERNKEDNQEKPMPSSTNHTPYCSPECSLSAQEHSFLLQLMRHLLHNQQWGSQFQPQLSGQQTLVPTPHSHQHPLPQLPPQLQHQIQQQRVPVPYPPLPPNPFMNPNFQSPLPPPPHPPPQYNQQPPLHQSPNPWLAPPPSAQPQPQQQLVFPQSPPQKQHQSTQAEPPKPLATRTAFQGIPGPAISAFAPISKPASGPTSVFTLTSAATAAPPTSTSEIKDAPKTIKKDNPFGPALAEASALVLATTRAQASPAPVEPASSAGTQEQGKEHGQDDTSSVGGGGGQHPASPRGPQTESRRLLRIWEGGDAGVEQASTGSPSSKTESTDNSDSKNTEDSEPKTSSSAQQSSKEDPQHVKTPSSIPISNKTILPQQIDSTTHGSSDKYAPWPSLAPTNAKLRNHHWREYQLPDYTAYFYNPRLKVVTDIDLYEPKNAESVQAFLDFKLSIKPVPEGWELWVREGEATAPSRDCSCFGRRRGKVRKKAGHVGYWVNHQKRTLGLQSPHDKCEEKGEATSGGMREQRLNLESDYWAFLIAHPAHTSLPAGARRDAENALSWVSSRHTLSYNQGGSVPFTQEQCEQLLDLVKATNDSMPGDAVVQSLIQTQTVSYVFFQLINQCQAHHYTKKTASNMAARPLSLYSPNSSRLYAAIIFSTLTLFCAYLACFICLCQPMMSILNAPLILCFKAKAALQGLQGLLLYS